MMITETKNKKVRSYFSKCPNTASQKTLLLHSLLNIVKNMKSENFNMEEVQKDTSYHIVPILFSSQENFISYLTTESKLFIIETKCKLPIYILYLLYLLLLYRICSY